jgi:UDP-glucose 4-epimerase
LQKHPEYLDVLGDGTQSKPYLHVTDCAAGLLHVHDNAKENLGVYNLGPADWTSVKHIAETVVATSPYPNARIEYGKERQGWPGDVPTSRLNIEKLAKLGFRVKHTSNEAVGRAIREIVKEVFG